jgi:HSP20 family protein
MRITKWQPFREMDELLQAYSPFLARIPLPRAFEGTPGSDWTPAANISETAQEYLIRAELPEVRKEDVEVSVQEGTITIRGERKLEKDEKTETVHRVESFYGTFSRRFSLPDNVDVGAIRAESRDGMLTVHLPKLAVEPAKEPVKIAVK